MQVKASLKHLHIAPRKVRLVTNLIRGMEVKQALLELSTLPKRSSLPILKLLKSAIQNAKHNFQLDERVLYIKEIRVDGGPVFKRFMPRAFGRAATIRKRTSHVNVILETKDGITSAVNKKNIKDELVVREAGAEDLKEDFTPQNKKETRSQSNAKPSSKPGFAKKMFRRKAI